MGAFSDSIKRNINKALVETNSKILAIAEDTFTKAVSFSPVQPSAEYAKGQFVNSWYVGINSVSSEVTTSLDSSGSESLARIAALRSTLTFLGKDGFVSLSNSLPYAARVEYLGWPKGTGYSGWAGNWTGQVGPYAPVRKASEYASATYNI